MAQQVENLTTASRVAKEMRVRFPSQAQGVKACRVVAAAAQIQFLAPHLPSAAGVAILKGKKKTEL